MITTNTGAKKLESSDNWREIFPDNQGAQGAHNASVGAHDAAICQTCQTINGTTNNSGHTINSGEFFIANGGKYKATASIPNGEPWASSADPVSDNDLIGALNSKIPTNIRSFADFSVSVPANGSTSFTLPRSGVYLIVGMGSIIKANSVAYIIGGYATASRSRITKLTNEDAITIDGSSTTSFTFGISNNANDVVTLQIIQLN